TCGNSENLPVSRRYIHMRGWNSSPGPSPLTPGGHHDSAPPRRAPDKIRRSFLLPHKGLKTPKGVVTMHDYTTNRPTCRNGHPETPSSRYVDGTCRACRAER